MKYILYTLLIISLFACRGKVELDGAFEGDIVGCENFLVYQMTTDRTMGIAITGITDSLDLIENNKTFEIADYPDEILKVWVDEFRQNMGFFSCSDPTTKLNITSHRWEAVSGTIQISNEGWENELLGTYRLSVTLSNILFRHDIKNAEVELNSFEIVDVLVGS